MEVPLGPHLLLYGSTLKVLKSYYMKVHLGQQKDVTILIFPIPIPFGISGIDSLQGNIKFENFEKVRVDSNFSIPKAVVQTLYITTVFENKALS